MKQVKFKRETIKAVWNNDGTNSPPVVALVLEGSGLAVNKYYTTTAHAETEADLRRHKKGWTITHVKSGKRILPGSVRYIKKLRDAKLVCRILAPLYEWNLPEDEFLARCAWSRLIANITAVVEHGENWRIAMVKERLKTRGTDEAR